MAGLRWMAVTLAFLLSAGNSLAAVDQNWLASIIEGIKNQYALGDTFSLAVNVPLNQDASTLQQVFQDDPADKVKQTVSEGQVYQGTRVVAAAQSAAVLENIQPLIKSNQGNVLIIYSEESPCGPTCTTASDDGIAAKVNDVIQNWSSGYAFVFSKVVNVPDADTSKLSESFKQLGISKFGLDNIFRCYKPGDDSFQCTSCSSGGDVAPTCVADTSPANQPQADGGEVSTVPPGTDTGADTGLSGGTGGGGGKKKGGRVKKCKGRKRGCKRRGGGKVRKWRKQRGGKRKKWGKARGVRKGKKGRKGKKWGKARGWGKGKKGRKGKKWGKARGWGKGKKGRKGKKWGKARGWGKRKKGRKGKRWGEI